MERAKTEVEKKVSKLVKFIQTKNKIPKDSKRELLGIVNDLQEQCQSLYSVFDDFQQDLDPNSGGGRRKGKSRIASSSSDLEYYSSEEIENVVDEGIEISELQSKLETLRNDAEERERELASRVKELERELGNAKAECDQKRGLEKEIAMKASESKQLGEKNKGLRSQISGLESVLREKGDEISTLVNKFGNSELGLTSRIEELKSQLRNLEEEIGFLRARNAELAKKYEVKRVEDEERVKGLVDQVNGMKRELESSRRQKDGSEAKLEKKVEEVTETEMQLKSLKEETEEERNRLNEEIEYLKGENEKLHTRIAELDSLNMEIKTKNADKIRNESKILDIQNSDQKKLVKEQDDIIRRLSEKLKDQQRLVEEQKDTIDKLSDDQKLSKRWSSGSSRDSKLNPNALEKKMEELAEDFRMKIEDHIRILYRRIHVAEQIHLESKHEYIKTREMAQENRESLMFFETHFSNMKDSLEKGYRRSEMAMKKLEEAEEQTKRVGRLGEEIESAKQWVSEKKSEVESLTAKLEYGEAEENLLKEKLSKLEKKLAEEGTEKLKLTKVVSKIETKMKELELKAKGREVEVLSLREEKREAIRQLCIVVDYQRDRYDQLKKSSILKGCC
ncbi:PREDICTED: protein NETWORKED 4B-like [Camelina sativa]|uniref:Protein NETWORKED 4B-like n=1 Tax=Camelina sativa TaxID=90675 RepID=A0ABM0WNK5_CAMSA|nr:PREDICTED: protein NETWORKED 4B-like [Camelina sativa]